MALQNRVDPWGALHAVTQRGTMMGNRGGKIHRDDKTLGKRRWASRQWICCELHFRGRHREVMGPAYTELFFLDEVTALAAGHRPCWECRRAEAKAFLGGEKAESFDRRVHGERLASAKLVEPVIAGFIPAIHRPTHENAEKWIPATSAEMTKSSVNGSMAEFGGQAYAIKGKTMLRWTFNGYDEALALNTYAKLLTPPSIIAILASRYSPRWHPSALQWDAT